MLCTGPAHCRSRKARLAWYSVATGLLVAATDVAFALTFELLDGWQAGLIERIGIIAGCSWIAVLAIRLMSKKVPRVFIE